MVPADSDDIRNEYHVLLSELEKYNPELLHKSRILAVTKADLLDEELKEEIRKELPEVLRLFISSVSGEGLDQLKDWIWKELNREQS
jgi:GTP-binding protein